jgi:hypothetical protein
MASIGRNNLIVAMGTLLASIALISHSGVLTAQERCNHGYVWREAFPGDYVCVTHDVRKQAQEDNAAAGSRYESGEHGPHTCKSPFVWREAFPGDLVCVTTERREQVRRENLRAGTVSQSMPTGGSGGSTSIKGQKLPKGGPYERAAGCRQGFVWREASPSDHVCVEPASRQLVQEENARAPDRHLGNTCKQGYVWREAGPSDFVCVEPAVREQTRRDNARHRTRIGRFNETLVRCGQYAREAVVQFHDMRGHNCGFSGPRWQGNYDAHYGWCLTAAEHDRGGEAGARRSQLRECGARAPSQGSPPAGEQCSFSVVIRNRSCLNGEGAPSSRTPGTESTTGCGNSVESARARANFSFALTFGCLSDDDTPAPGCCTVSEEIVNGCLCR